MLYIERIKQFRQENNITQTQVAEILGISQQQYFKYEKGINELPIRYLFAICKAYGISADWLLGLSNNKQWYIRRIHIKEKPLDHSPPFIYTTF